ARTPPPGRACSWAHAMFVAPQASGSPAAATSAARRGRPVAPCRFKTGARPARRFIDLVIDPPGNVLVELSCDCAMTRRRWNSLARGSEILAPSLDRQPSSTLLVMESAPRSPGTASGSPPDFMMADIRDTDRSVRAGERGRLPGSEGYLACRGNLRSRQGPSFSPSPAGSDTPARARARCGMCGAPLTGTPA